MAMARSAAGSALLVLLTSLMAVLACRAQLSQGYYSSTCPNVETLVRAAVVKKLRQSFNAGPGTLRLFFHDCFVRGCDASILLRSPTGDDEQHAGPDATLSPEALDLIDKAKAAVDGDPHCAGKVSCADLLAIAARDVVSLSGGPSFPVELGRLDGKVATAASVKNNLPGAGFNLDQLNALFSENGLSQTDMIALSGAHTIGVSHCGNFVRRIYAFKNQLGGRLWPPMDVFFMRKLRQSCPVTPGPSAFAVLDSTTPLKFDNAYFQNLQAMRGVLASDQILFSDARSRGTVTWFASNQTAFFEAFAAAMAKLGRVGVKTGADGEIRKSCSAVN